MPQRVRNRYRPKTKSDWEMVDGVMRKKKKATHQGGKKVTGKTPEPTLGMKLKRGAKKVADIYTGGLSNKGVRKKIRGKLGEFWDGS